MNDTAREPINLATTFGADPTVEVDVECSACRGTGLYVGMCENDGAAVVCVKCNGTGKVHMSLTPFTGRRKRDGVTRVFETNPGFIGLRGSDREAPTASLVGSAAEGLSPCARPVA